MAQAAGNLQPFAKEEFRRRVGRLQGKMRARGAQGLIADMGEYMSYLAGFEISNTLYRACLVPVDGDPVMVLRELDEEPFFEASWLTEHRSFRDWDDPVEIVADTLRGMGLARSAIAVDLESNCLTVCRFEALRRALPDATFIDMSGELAQMALRKSPAEVAYLRRVASIVDAAMVETIDATRQGMTERDVQAFACSALFRLGADHGLVGPITRGVGDGFLHCPTRDRPLAKGDILHVELVPKYRGYAARLMRSTVIGPPTKKQYDIAAKLIDIQNRQIAAIRPGARAKEVDAICRQGLLDSGLRTAVNNVTAYTLGFYPATTPRSSNFYRAFLPNADWLIESNMVFHVYASAKGIAISETVLVTEAGQERLTKAERKLFTK